MFAFIVASIRRLAVVTGRRASLARRGMWVAIKPPTGMQAAGGSQSRISISSTAHIFCSRYAPMRRGSRLSIEGTSANAFSVFDTQIA
jgi:hypothetical protein